MRMNEVGLNFARNAYSPMLFASLHVVNNSDT